MNPLVKPRRFLSLKWKALFSTSIVLVLMTGAFAAFSYVQTQKQFERRRENLQNQYALQVQGILDQSGKRLRDLAAAVASLPDVQLTLSEGHHKGAADSLASVLQLNLGVENFALVSVDGVILTELGSPDRTFELPVSRDVIRAVSESEKPRELVDCSRTCLQYALAPVVNVRGGHSGIVILALSLADVVLDFNRFSGMDLGLTLQYPPGWEPATSQENWIGAWNASIAAISNPARNIELLRNISLQKGNTPSRLLQPLAVQFGGHEFEVRMFPLTGFNSEQKAHLVVVADISNEVADIRAATRRSLYIGLAGLLVAECLLLFTLSRPMSRIRRAADTLPGLADGDFATVRTAISEATPRNRYRDEVDVLNETATALSHELERLNAEVVARTHDLSERLAEIQRDRNFVAHVLNSAQAVILTQNQHGAILQINPYGETLTGYSSNELAGTPFLSLVASDQTRHSIEQTLAELFAGKRQHFEAECDLTSKDGSTVNIVWQHSRLQAQREDPPMILSVGMDITARKRAELRLEWLADHDPLTGLLNRRRFEQEMEHAVAQCRRYGHSGALLFFDLDQFKYINDTSGHGTGDTLLKTLSESLPPLLREVDAIGRLGGDEFAILLGRATASEAIEVAKKILTYIASVELYDGDRMHKISASLGIALFPDHGTDVRDLLVRADLAMYQVKESGRGGWHLLQSDDQSHRQMHERVLWKQRIEDALRNDRFLLYAQPIVSLTTRQVNHYEVLLRMCADDGGIIGPAQFVQVAERSGLIHRLDRFVLSQATRFQAEARERGQAITLAVNLSAHAFQDVDLPWHIESLLKERDLDPRHLIFEVTETAALADLPSARRLMDSINDIGCRFALDDFGTGFSSFYYLKHLPFDYIKIDGSFIRSLADSTDDRVLVKAMAEIAKAFNKATIAEHVENERTLAMLEAFEIDYVQGYHTGRPVDIKTVLVPQASATN